MILRRILTGAAIASAVLVQAQSLASAQTQMGWALNGLGQLTRTTFEKIGYEESNGFRTDYTSTLAIRRGLVSGDVYTEIEYKSYKGTALQTRVVTEISPTSDPKVLERRLCYYDATRNTYAIWSYGHLGAKADISMLQTLKKVVRPDDAILAQLAEESEYAAANGVSAAVSRWRPFLSLATVATSTGNIQAVLSSGAKYNEHNYAINEPTPGDYHLSRVDFYGERPGGAALLITDWSIAVYESSLPTTVNFTFNPGTAKPMANSIFQGK
ncbi:MAG: hypothetical protein KF824_13185 [Fimbriimonadaceae bacterium]|nr:MAG: hypothetical protein KF824_13185 [Fimbriimonadaceae bacterium]